MRSLTFILAALVALASPSRCQNQNIVVDNVEYSLSNIFSADAQMKGNYRQGTIGVELATPNGELAIWCMTTWTGDAGVRPLGTTYPPPSKRIECFAVPGVGVYMFMEIISFRDFYDFEVTLIRRFDEDERYSFSTAGHMSRIVDGEDDEIVFQSTGDALPPMVRHGRQSS